jgi:hypothetical protein
MATYYAQNTYKQNPIRSTLYEALYPPTEHPGILYTQYFNCSIPVGFTTADIMKLSDFAIAAPVTVPQNASVRFTRAVLRAAGDVGGSVTVNFGFVSAATAFGSALTTLQSAGTLDVPIATVMAATGLIANDTLQLVAAAGTSTTVRVVDGFIQYYIIAP